MANSRSRQAARRAASRSAQSNRTAPPTIGTDPARRADAAHRYTLRATDDDDRSDARIRRSRVSASASGMPSGDGSGRYSDWCRPMVLPYSVSVTTNDHRWSATVSR